jgi:dihydropteroate synthase
MKISEIKKCFDDKRISDCVAKTFWEEKDFSNALGSSKIETTPDNVLPATIAAHTLALERGADILRVHDVKAAVQAIRIHQLTHNKF